MLGVGEEEGPGLPATEEDTGNAGGRVTWAWGRLSQEEPGTEEGCCQAPSPTLPHRPVARTPTPTRTGDSRAGARARQPRERTWDIGPGGAATSVGLWCLLPSKD